MNLKYLSKIKPLPEKQAGDYALYNITGQKADILLWYLRPEMKELNEIENELNKLRIAISSFKLIHMYL